MKNLFIGTILVLNPIMVNAASWLDYTDLPETRKHIIEDLSVIIQACKNKESYTSNKNFASIEYLVKACSVSGKFPIGSKEKLLCNYIAKENLDKSLIVCSQDGVKQKYSEEDLAPHYKKFRIHSPQSAPSGRIPVN